ISGKFLVASYTWISSILEKNSSNSSTVASIGPIVINTTSSMLSNKIISAIAESISDNANTYLI
ncbi:hypothetical protein ACJBQY_10700, partial [Streptococcus suis]